MLFQESEAKILIDVENFIDNVSAKKLTGQQLLDKLYEVCLDFDSVHQPDYVYSAKINALIDVMYHDKGFLEDELSGYVKDLVCSQQDAFASELLANQKQEIKNRHKLTHYVKRLLTHYSRLLFIRVDLSYLRGEHHGVDIADFKYHTSKLTRIIARKRDCFEHLQGYAWALEQGKDKGYHCHLLLMFDGSKHQSDWYLANQVGELWQGITHQQGIYFSCNDPDYKQGYIQRGKLGIGMIHRNNPHEVNNALDTVAYLVAPEKTAQFLRVKTSKFMKTFGTGVFHTRKRRNTLNTLQRFVI